MHQTKKSVHILSDLSSCLSFGDNGKVAFFKPGTYTCIHNDAYTLYHTDTESWDSEEDIYRVNQKSDNLWDSKKHRPSFGQPHKRTLPSKNACEYTRSVVLRIQYYMYDITITALYGQLNASRRAGKISGHYPHVHQWIPLCLTLRRIKVGLLKMIMQCINHKLLTQQPLKPEEVIGQDSSSHHYWIHLSKRDVLPEKVRNQCAYTCACTYKGLLAGY